MPYRSTLRIDPSQIKEEAPAYYKCPSIQRAEWRLALPNQPQLQGGRKRRGEDVQPLRAGPPPARTFAWRLPAYSCSSAGVKRVIRMSICFETPRANNLEWCLKTTFEIAITKRDHGRKKYHALALAEQSAC